MLNKLSALSTKIIVLILFLYSALTVIITFAVVSQKDKTKILDGYSEKTQDEYVKLTVRFWEERTSSLGNNSDYESTKYYMRAFLEETEYAISLKEEKTLEIQNIKYYVTGLAKNGKYLFDESTSTTVKIAQNSTYTTSTTSNIIGGSIFKQSISVDSSTNEEEITDNRPLELYVNVSYTLIIDDESVERNLKSLIKITNPSKENFDEYEDSTLDSKYYITNESEAIDVEIKPTLATEESVKGDIKKDKYNFETELNQTYLGEKTIENFSVEVFGKVSTRDTGYDIFSDYIRMYTCYGSSLVEKTSSDTIYSGYQIDEAYDIETLYVKTVVEFTDGTSSVRKIKISVK